MAFLISFFAEHSFLVISLGVVATAGASFLIARSVYKTPEKKSSARGKKAEWSEEFGESWALPMTEVKRAARTSEKSDVLKNLTITERRSIIATGIVYLVVAIGMVYVGLIAEYLATKAFVSFPLLRVLFGDPILFFVIGFSLAWGVANVFQNIVIGSNSVQMFNNLISKKHLFVDKTQYHILLKKFLTSAYSRSWNFWTSVQPLLSMLVGVVVYFVFISGIAWSGAERTNPNVFFYAAMAFLSGFFYDKFLEFLSRVSNQVLGGEGTDQSIAKDQSGYIDRLFEKFSGFDSEKVEIITESIEWENMLSETYEKSKKPTKKSGEKEA